MVNRIYESGVGDIRTRGKKTAMIVALIKKTAMIVAPL